MVRSWDDSEVRHTGTAEDAEAESSDKETGETGKSTVNLIRVLSSSLLRVKRQALLVSGALCLCHTQR